MCVCGKTDTTGIVSRSNQIGKLVAYACISLVRVFIESEYVGFWPPVHSKR